MVLNWHPGSTAALATAVGLALALTGCGSGPASPDQADVATGGEIPTATSESLVDAAVEEGRLVWYTSNTRPAADAAAGLFEETYPGIQVEVFQAGGSQVTAKVEAELLSGNVQADVVDYSDGSVAVDQAARGVFERYLPEDADQISEELQDAEGYWFSPYYLTSTIVYNPTIIAEADAPKSWQELTLPKWSGKVGMASPDYAGTAVGTIGTWEQEFGEEYIAALGANGLTVFEGFGNVHDAVLSGQTPVGVNLSFRALTAQAQGEPMAYVTPEEGQVMLPSAAAIIKETENINAAKLFANFLLSDELQTMMTETVRYFPAKTEILANVEGMPSPTEMKTIKGDTEVMAEPEYVARVKNLFKEATS